MEAKNGKFHPNEKQPLEVSTASEAREPIENIPSPPVFIKHAAIAWHESRRKWIGYTSQRSERIPKDLIISWSMTYEELLSHNEPFPVPIPLPEMVDFLVDIWQDEGLFDY